MKIPLRDLEKRISEFSQFLAKKRDLTSAQIEKWHASIFHDFDRIFQNLDAKKNHLRETAIAQADALRRFRASVFSMLFPIRFRLLLGAPIIYAMIVPALILDLFLFIYQQVFFRLLRIPRVRRSDHLCFDRRLLPYLNVLEKFNCFYCSYFNGLMSFAREVAGRTERYFCPIKNARRRYDPHAHYEKFFDYLDGEGYRRDRCNLRSFSKEK